MADVKCTTKRSSFVSLNTKCNLGRHACYLSMTVVVLRDFGSREQNREDLIKMTV